MLINASTVPDCPASGIDQLHPDWNTLRICEYCPDHACVMCRVSDSSSGKPVFTRCPRTHLARTLLEAGEKHGILFTVGFELEVMFLDASHTPPVPFDDTLGGWSIAAGLRNDCVTLVQEIIMVLQKSAIGVQQFHTEGQMGQFEIVLDPSDPMDAIDSLVYAHETIKTLSAKKNVKATMIPKPGSQKDSLGCHAHLSLSPFTQHEDHFLAGILQCLPAICVFGMPSYDSYFRVQDFKNMTGVWVSWGTQNGDVPVRKISGGHWEFRFIDATTNMYLTLASIISAGMLGISEKQGLRWNDCREFTSDIEQERRIAMGIDMPLPRTLKQALELLKYDNILDRLLGKDMIGRYIAVKETEEQFMSNLTEAERRAFALNFF